MATAKVTGRSALSTVLCSPTQNGWRALPPEERQKLLLENLTEVRQVARRIHVRLPRHVPFNDLVQEGVVGLIDAVEKYDPAKNVRLRSYARLRIRGAILDSLRELDWGPRQLRRQARRIDQARNQLACQLGRAPSEPEVAAQLGVSLEEFQRVLSEIHRLSVEAVDTLPQLISNQGVFIGRSRALEDPFDVCVRAETTRTLEHAMEALGQKARQALTLYYFEERTMKEVGRVLHVQESRVSQIISTALDRLRTLMHKNQNTRAGTEFRRRRSCDRRKRTSRSHQRRHAAASVTSAIHNG